MHLIEFLRCPVTLVIRAFKESISERLTEVPLESLMYWLVIDFNIMREFLLFQLAISVYNIFQKESSQIKTLNI
jgi:hypothetical protein